LPTLRELGIGLVAFSPLGRGFLTGETRLPTTKLDFKTSRTSAHLIRDAQYVIDEGDAAFAPGLKDLLKRACAIGRRRDALAGSTLKIYHGDLNRRLDRLLSLKPTHKAGRKLQETIKAIRGHLFVFVTNRDLEAANNGLERALRPCAVYRKIINGFRRPMGRKVLCRHSLAGCSPLRGPGPTSDGW